MHNKILLSLCYYVIMWKYMYIYLNIILYVLKYTLQNGILIQGILKASVFKEWESILKFCCYLKNKTKKTNYVYCLCILITEKWSTFDYLLKPK